MTDRPTGAAMPEPAPGWRERATLVDGNALAGGFADLFAGDASVLVASCGACGARGALAETVVEVDDHAFIVRCRACTHTLLTLQRTADGVVLRLGRLASLER